MNKVVLVINNFSWFGKRTFRTWLPAVPIITALLNEQFDFSIIDANVNEWNFDQTKAAIRESNADLILISALSIDYQIQYHKLAELAKEVLPECITLMGGIYPTSLPNQVMEDKNVDFIIQGYAEERLPIVVKAILNRDYDYLGNMEGIGFKKSGKLHFIPFNKFLINCRTFVQPDYSLLDINRYFLFQSTYSAKNYSTECAEKKSVNIISSYGCSYNCFFCANRALSGSRVAYRPISDVLDEIDYFVKNYQIEQISFMDDNIVADKERAKLLFRELIRRNYNIEIQIGNLAAWDLDDEILDLLHKAGCTRIGISVESGSQRVLYKIMHKPLNLEIIPPLVQKFKKLGIMMVADFIIGLPGETWTDIRTSLTYAENMGADLCNINIAVPYPGTEMYEYMVENNLLPDDFKFDERFFVNGLVKTSEFTPAELKTLVAFEWERINASTKEKREKAKKVLRLSDQELNQYCRDMRLAAIRFAKKYS